MYRTLAIVAVALILSVLAAPISYAAPSPTGSLYHQVRYGETLFSIGRLYNVSPYAIASANGLSDPDLIYAGQQLWIPSGPPYPWPSGACPTSWSCIDIVQPGDNLYRISLRYGVSMWDLAQHNGIFDLNYIWAGQRLSVPCCYDP